MKRGVVMLALALACAANVTPRTSERIGLDDDESRLWQVAGEISARLDRTDAVVVDAGLERYLADVARRLEPPATFAATPFRIRVLRDRRPNAFCLPNGAIYVHTGMLARIESEAELAVLLAHEMTHATHRHALRQLRSANRTGALLATLGAVAGSGAGGGPLLLLATSGYSRELEREADREGLALAAAAGYDVTASTTLFERLRSWAAEEKVDESSAFYSSHPRIEERIASCRELITARGAHGGVRGDQGYADATAAILVSNGRDELAAGRYARARAEVERYLGLRPRDARAHALLGDVARREASPGFEDAALASYRRAVELDPAVPDAWRGMGLVLRRRGRLDDARAAFVRYLELAPDAPDVAHVRAALDDTSGGSP